jgi:hypothetical protein
MESNLTRGQGSVWIVGPTEEVEEEAQQCNDREQCYSSGQL